MGLTLDSSNAQGREDTDRRMLSVGSMLGGTPVSSSPYNQSLEQALLAVTRAYYEHTNAAAFVLPLDKDKGLYVAVGSLEDIRELAEGEIEFAKRQD